MKILRVTTADMLFDRALGLDMLMPKIIPTKPGRATREAKWKVGDVVYRVFSPQTVGCVVGSRWGTFEAGRTYSTDVVTWIMMVKQPSGKTYEYPDRSLMDYRALVAEHKRKAVKHEAKLRQIERGR